MPEKTVTRSFRINENAFLALEEEAKKRNISLNTLVNQLFMSYANFDRYFQRLGMIKISKVTFRKILNVAPTNEIVEVAREVAQNSSRVIILAKYGTMSLTSVLEYLNNYADYSSFVERSEVVSPGGKRVITLIHSYGEKGSIFVKAYTNAFLDCICKLLGQRKIRLQQSASWSLMKTQFVSSNVMVQKTMYRNTFYSNNLCVIYK